MANKRGQDLSITTLLLIVLGIIVVVIIIMGFTVGWNFIFDKFKFAPGQNLQVLAKSCEIAVQAELQVDYCQFKKLDSDQYVNCNYDKLVYEKKGKYTCEDEVAGNTIKQECEDLIGSNDLTGDKCKNTKLKVNEEMCNKYCDLELT